MGHQSTPHISLVKFDIMLFKKMNILFLKRFSSVMFTLPFDISHCVGYLGKTNRECPISILPCKRRHIVIVFMNPA